MQEEKKNKTVLAFFKFNITGRHPTGIIKAPFLVGTSVTPYNSSGIKRPIKYQN